MHLSIAVVGRGILLQTFSHGLVVDHDRLLRRGRLLEKVYYIKQLPGVTPGIAEQGVGGFNLHMPFLQYVILLQGTVKQGLEVLLVERLQRVDLRA